ncbi:hypothetical protein SS05631_a47210 (plasmid) [Sinorhizobium sp. CCBAU 05631]|nr:hypothetical protein SS05631_a47210 [Sinorhizobium sp. CCBAU 05631]
MRLRDSNGGAVTSSLLVQHFTARPVGKAENFRASVQDSC